MPVVLLPTHRSYVDFLIVSYVCFNYGLPLPRAYRTHTHTDTYTDTQTQPNKQVDTNKHT